MHGLTAAGILGWFWQHCQSTEQSLTTAVLGPPDRLKLAITQMCDDTLSSVTKDPSLISDNDGGFYL